MTVSMTALASAWKLAWHPCYDGLYDKCCWPAAGEYDVQAGLKARAHGIWEGPLC